MNNFLDFFHFWHDCWPWPIDYLIRFWSIFVVTLTFHFKVKYGICYISAKMLRLPQNEKQTHQLNSRPQMWPWPWPWIFEVKSGICHKTKSKHIDWTLGLKCDHDLDLEFSRSNLEFAISQPKMIRLPWNKKQPYWFNIRPQTWPSGLTLGMTLTLNF